MCREGVVYLTDLLLLNSFNHGQCCCAGSRVYVQESIYDSFMQKFTEHIKSLKVGDPFEKATFQGPQISQIQFDVSIIILVCLREANESIN